MMFVGRLCSVMLLFSISGLNHLVTTSAAELSPYSLTRKLITRNIHEADILHDEDYELHHSEEPCPKGCEERGNCNKELGRCECPIGWGGPDCSTWLWGKCRTSKEAPEAFCNGFYPKSCSCLRQCVKTFCPDEKRELCELRYDYRSFKCFERGEPDLAKEDADPGAWDGGMDIPPEGEPGVQYFKGVYPQDRSAAASSVNRSDFLKLDRRPDDVQFAFPLDACPDKCSHRGVCVNITRDPRPKPICICYSGYKGTNCSEESLKACPNDCQGRGICKRGFCHCQPGFWGRDCERSKVYKRGSSVRVAHKLKIYVYDLPWHMNFHPESHVGKDINFLSGHIYSAGFAFTQLLYADNVTRTENPWEANMFYIPSATFAYSDNLGDTLLKNRRVIHHIRTSYPFFNRTMGVDHFIWLPNDRGACKWPGPEEPEMANVIKVQHFGFHHVGPPLPGWKELPNKIWGCHHPTRDIVAPPMVHAGPNWAKSTYGINGTKAVVDLKAIPPKLLFHAGGVRLGSPDYSNGVRQAAFKYAQVINSSNITIIDGRVPDYLEQLKKHKYCLATSGHGWGIRVSVYMFLGCVPVIIQDNIYQPYDFLLPYTKFSVRVPKRRINHLMEVLSAIPDEDYLALRAGMAKYWPAFMWQKEVGGLAYDYALEALEQRMFRMEATYYRPLGHHNHTRSLSQPPGPDNRA